MIMVFIRGKRFDFDFLISFPSEIKVSDDIRVIAMYMGFWSSEVERFHMGQNLGLLWVGEREKVESMSGLLFTEVAVMVEEQRWLTDSALKHVSHFKNLPQSRSYWMWRHFRQGVQILFPEVQRKRENRPIIERSKWSDHVLSCNFAGK